MNSFQWTVLTQVCTFSTFLECQPIRDVLYRFPVVGHAGRLAVPREVAHPRVRCRHLSQVTSFWGPWSLGNVNLVDYLVAYGKGRHLPQVMGLHYVGHEPCEVYEHFEGYGPFEGYQCHHIVRSKAIPGQRILILIICTKLTTKLVVA